MIEFIASLPPGQLVLLAYIWLCVCTWATVWICPRLFQYLPEDEE